VRPKSRKPTADIWRPKGVLTRSADGRPLVDGKPVSTGDVDPGSAPDSAPAESPDEPRYRFGDGDDAPELTKKEINDLRAHRAAEESRKLTLPSTPEGYKAELPQSFKAPTGFENYRPDEKHPLFFEARQFALKHKLDQAAFSEMLALSASREIGTAQMLEAARNREIAKMGVNGSAIIGAANTFLQAKLGPELFKAIEPLLATSKMYEAIGVWQREALNGGSSNFSASRSTSERRESISESEWNQMTYHQKKEYSSRMSGSGRR
jgi:hypothetical protein